MSKNNDHRQLRFCMCMILWWHPNRRKMFGNNGKSNQYDFMLVSSKCYWTTFETILEKLYQLCGPFTLPLFVREVYTKSMIVEISWEYLSDSFIFLYKIFFGSWILSSSCDKHQKFDYGCSTLKQGSKILAVFDHFWHFRAVWFGISI